ncbi:MAG: DUF6134 family protein [Pseudomonadota bacterium]
MPNRRVFLSGVAATLAAPAVASATADREFRIIRDGDDIGSHRLDAAVSANGFEIAITIRIAVKIFGITAYRYEMDNREVWREGRIVSVDSRVNDDGTEERCIINAREDVLSIEGSRFSGEAALDAVTTSYYAAPFLERRPWLSTQSGAPLELSINQDSRPRWWSVRGELDTNLGYDDADEWIACEFDAGGEPARYEIASGSGRIGELWSSA